MGLNANTNFQGRSNKKSSCIKEVTMQWKVGWNVVVEEEYFELQTALVLSQLYFTVIIVVYALPLPMNFSSPVNLELFQYLQVL